PGDSHARSDIVRVSLNRPWEELQIVANTGVYREAWSHAPFILQVEADVRVGLRLRGWPERLLEIDIAPSQEIREGRKRILAPQKTREGDVDVVVEKIDAGFDGMRAA